MKILKTVTIIVSQMMKISQKLTLPFEYIHKVLINKQIEKTNRKNYTK